MKAWLSSLVMSFLAFVPLQFPEDDIRVIFINTYSDVARIVLCEVAKC